MAADKLGDVNAAALPGRNVPGDGQLGEADLALVDVTALFPVDGRPPAVIWSGEFVAGSLGGS